MWKDVDMENQPYSLLSILIQLAVVEPTEVNISASGSGFAICQVCNNVQFCLVKYDLL